jgi:hypothetical protein
MITYVYEEKICWGLNNIIYKRVMMPKALTRRVGGKQKCSLLGLPHRPTSPTPTSSPLLSSVTLPSHPFLFPYLSPFSEIDWKVPTFRCLQAHDPSMVPTFNFSGDVVLAARVSHWFGRVVRGDVVMVRAHADPKMMVGKRGSGYGGYVIPQWYSPVPKNNCGMWNSCSCLRVRIEFKHCGCTLLFCMWCLILCPRVPNS